MVLPSFIYFLTHLFTILALPLAVFLPLGDFFLPTALYPFQQDIFFFFLVAMYCFIVVPLP
tara:strand:- start:924 stop:1106 length:183 start_codon:yes stop_codon:yes gene_type:complete